VISQAAGFLDDPEGLREMLDVVDRLAEDPRPAGSFPRGSPDLRRMATLVATVTQPDLAAALDQLAAVYWRAGFPARR
jgi:hypothetical protein